MVDSSEIWDKISEEYQQDLLRLQNLYLNKWVRHKKKKKCISPGLVLEVTMSHREAVCKIKWADSKISTESGFKLEILS